MNLILTTNNPTIPIQQASMKNSTTDYGPLFSGDFDGKHFDPELDAVRLTQQMRDVFECLCGGHGWLTVSEIKGMTGHPEASISAQLRNMRKVKFGALDIRGRYREGTRTFEYKYLSKQQN